MESNFFVNSFSVDRIMQLVYLQLLLCFLVGIQYLFLVGYEKIQKRKWRVVGEGVFEKVLSKKAPITAELVEGVFPLVIDAVFFKNGDTCATKWIRDDFPESGTPIRVRRNGLGECRVERV